MLSCSTGCVPGSVLLRLSHSCRVERAGAPRVSMRKGAARGTKVGAPTVLGGERGCRWEGSTVVVSSSIVDGRSIWCRAASCGCCLPVHGGHAPKARAGGLSQTTQSMQSQGLHCGGTAVQEQTVALQLASQPRCVGLPVIMTAACSAQQKSNQDVLIAGGSVAAWLQLANEANFKWDSVATRCLALQTAA
jgi:hypothetical protein